MNPIEKLILEFAKNELTKNPQFAGDLLLHALQQTKLDPTLVNDLVTLAEQVLPVILGAIKV